MVIEMVYLSYKKDDLTLDSNFYDCEERMAQVGDGLLVAGKVLTAEQLFDCLAKYDIHQDRLCCLRERLDLLEHQSWLGPY